MMLRDARALEADVLVELTFAAWRKERHLQTAMLRARFVAADTNGDRVLQLTEFWKCINAFTDVTEGVDAGVARGRAEELFNETVAESEALDPALTDDAISEDAFVAVMLRRGLRDADYDAHFERHPEQRATVLHPG